MTDAPPKLRVLHLVGLPDDHRAQVLFLSPDSTRMRFGYGGNAEIDPMVDAERFEMTPLLCGNVAGEAGAMARLDVALCAIGDPDRNGESLARAAEVIDSLGIGVVNDPSVVARTTRDAVARLLEDIDGLDVPGTRRVGPRLAAEIFLATRDGDIEFPFVFHDPAGAKPVVVTGPQDLPKLDRYAFDGRSFYISDFRDFRSDDGLYRRYGVFVIGGTVARTHMTIDDHALVDHGNRRYMRSRLDLKIEADDWVLNGSTDASVFRIVHDRLGLDFFGVDYGVAPDGTMVLLNVDVCAQNLRPGSDDDTASQDYVMPQIRDTMTMLLAGRSTVRHQSVDP